jgi:hypothetical protein
VEDGPVLDLIPETVDDGEQSLGAAIGLRLGECFRGDFFSENGGRGWAAEDAILAEGEEGLEEVVAEGEAPEKLLPWKKRTVEEPLKSLS